MLHCRFSIGGDQLIEVSSLDRQALKDAISEVRRLSAIASDHQICNLDLFGGWIDRYMSRKKSSNSSSLIDSAADIALSAQDRLSKLLTSPPISPSVTLSTPSPSFHKPPNVAPDLPEWRLNWLNERLRELEDDYVTSQPIKVRVGTWNVYGKQPVESLQDWIVPDAGRDRSDLYVICLQEIDDTSEAYVRYTPHRENFWCEVMQKSIESTGVQKVIKVSSQQLVGLLIIVFVDESRAKNISDVSATYVGTGTLGMGNKGATAVRLKFFDTYLTLVNSHLAAFQDQCEARNRDYLEICRRITFPTRPGTTPSSISIPKLIFAAEGPYAPSPRANIFQTGHLIWAGDLNYRLDTTYAEAKALAQSGSKQDCHTLLSFDQLKRQIEAGLAFQQFSEGAIEFEPTYKFDVGTNDFDTSEKRRIPSYTDRILYLPGRVNDIQVLSYDSYPSITLSDHKPVASSMEVQVYTILKDKKDKIQFELLRELDGLENEALPDIQVEPEGMEFKIFTSESECSENLVVNGGELVGSSIELTNLKKFTVAWQIVPKNGESNVCEDWLKISQLSGNLSPGDSTQIHFAIDSIEANRRRSQLGTDDLTDVVVLSVQGGRDIFIPINVEF